ncbi:MAG: thermonuclease family protein, partial [Alphaproteobacteria bacterium]
EVAGPPKIIDGDTIEVAGTAIRLYGIDAPEFGQTCRIGKHAYDCGQIARTALLDLTAGVTVRCRLAPLGPEDAGSRDDSSQDGGTAGNADGRIGRCSADGYDLSEGMTYTGWALALRPVSERYVAFEEGARAAGRGLWKGQFIAPWDWREGARLPQTTAE